MVYAQPFLRLAVSGTLYDVEQFSWSLSLVDAAETANPPTVVPPAIVTAISAYHSSGSGSLSAVAKMKTIKLNEIGVDGRYTSPNTVRHDFTTPVAGAGGNYPPAQVALAISLLTPIQRGRAHQGRYYLPAPNLTGTSTGGLLVASQDMYLAAAKTMIEAVNNAMKPYRVAVVSNIGPGTFQLVTGVRVGAVLDTMRSRRKKIPESYKDSALVLPT